MNKLLVLGCGLAASLPLLAHAAAPEATTKPPRPELEGAWQVAVTLRAEQPDCANSEIIGFPPNPFLQLNTFHRGGTMSEFATRSPPSTRTPGHGVWERTGFRTFDYRYVFYDFDVNGLVEGTFDFRAELKLARDGGTFEGVSRLLWTDTSGNEFRFCTTLEGERITL